LRTLDRFTAILDAVAASAGPIQPVAVARMVNLPLPTVSRLMRELEKHRFLEVARTSNAYGLGSRLLELGYLARPTNLSTIVIPEMEWLRDVTGETVSLHVRSEDKRVCVSEVQSTKSVRRVVPIGLIVPLHYGATGQVLLAAAPPAFIKSYLAKLDLDPAAEQALMDELEAVRSRSWAMAVDSWINGLAGLAAPVKDGEIVVASLAVSGPSSRWDRKTMSMHVDDIVAAARRASTRLSGRPGEQTARAKP